MVKQEELALILAEELRAAVVDAVASQGIISRNVALSCKCKSFNPDAHLLLVAANDELWQQPMPPQKIPIVDCMVTIIAQLVANFRSQLRKTKQFFFLSFFDEKCRYPAYMLGFLCHAAIHLRVTL